MPRRLTMLMIVIVLSLLLWLPALGAETPLFSDEFFQQHGAVMLIIEPQSGDILNANPAAADFYGYSVATLRTMRIQQINILTDPEILQERLRAAEERNGYFIFRHRLASGELRSVEVYSSSIHVQQRHVLLSIIHDVTLRERFRDNLGQDEARLRFVEKFAGFGHWLFDVQHGMYRLSPGAEKIMGLRGEHWSDEVLRELVLPADRPLMKEARRRLIEENQDYDVFVQIRRGDDGALRDLHSRAHYDAQKKQMLGVVEDITDYKQATRALEAQSRAFVGWMSLAVLAQFVVIVSLVLVLKKLRRTQRILSAREAKLSTLLRSIQDLIFVFDAEGRIVEYHSPDEALLLAPAENFLGRHYSQVLPAEVSASLEVLLRDLAAGSPAQVLEYTLPIANQRHYFMALVSTISHAAGGAASSRAYLAVVRDVTPLKEKELLIATKNAELERFNYTVSHDLKNPLVTVKSFVGFLEQDIRHGDSQRIATDLHYIRNATDQMACLLDDLLHISKVGWVCEPVQHLQLQALLQQVLMGLRGQIGERNITFVLADHDLYLSGDPSRLIELWQNLVSNAIKYMGAQPQPRIEIGFLQQDDETLFYVRDNGIGIEARYAHKIFGLFEQLDRRSEGSGLGLALVKRIVEQYDGRIWLESKGPDSGSCFYFTLPKAVDAATPVTGGH